MGSHFAPESYFLLGIRPLLVAVLAFPLAAHAASRVYPVPVPQEMRSTAFTVTVDGQPVGVAHAAANYEFVNFDVTGPVDVAITAAQAGFWDRGVDVQPWRLGIRPIREGRTIRFHLYGPAKLSISRPRDFLNHAQMLFLFAGAPPPPAPSGPSVTVIPAGVHKQSLNPESGDTIYLAPGAFVFGSLNLWNVENVKVLGRGTIVYEGSQDPNADEGWFQKPDWHCIGTMNAKNVEIDGVTCIVRARTWSIQMKDSTGLTYNDLRVIGGNPGNANQDGMDWLGGGNSIVRDAFIRASDDDFAIMGNWDGYTDEEMLRPGKDVQNVLIENSEVSTSISNVMRAGWPRKTFNSRNITLRDSDILHGGIGACVQTFGLLGFWGANGAKGDHSDYTFENLFIDDWYSLVQMEQENPKLHGFTFRNIWALDQPPLIDSTIIGDVSDVTFDNVKDGQNVTHNNFELPVTVSGGAQAPKFVVTHTPVAHFAVNPPVFGPGDKVTFIAQAASHAQYMWLFGDGTQAEGRTVTHRFADAEGTELDGGATGAGRFRVLLHVRDEQEGEDWAAHSVVVVGKWHDAVPVAGPTVAGLAWKVYPGTWTELPDLTKENAVLTGESPNLRADAQGFTRYAAVWDGLIDIPADGGYTFHVIDADGARVVIDDVLLAKTGPPFAQVCGAPGNALQYDRGSLGLRAGKHAIHVEGLHSLSQGVPRILWEGPGLPLTDVPVAAYSHLRKDVIQQGIANRE
jgi:hypothetical protein